MKVQHNAIAIALIAGACLTARAQGIPVIDAANLVQTIQQVVNDITKINNQVQQITQL
jgi:type IV secretion system protein VirB5